MSKELKVQLKEFKEKPIPLDYLKVSIPVGQVIVEIFVDGGDDNEEDKPTILTYDYEGNLVSSKELLDKKSTHIAKVIVSNSDDYKEGDLVLLKPSDCIGETWNPEFLHLHQFSRSSGIEPIVPKGMKEKVTKFQARMIENAFLLPHEYNKKSHEIFTYIIHSNRIQAKWEL